MVIRAPSNGGDGRFLRRSRRLKQSRVGDLGLNRIKRSPSDPQHQLAVLLRRQGRIPAQVLDADPLDHAMGADRKRDRGKSAHHGYDEALPLQLLRDRCAATVTAPSGRFQDDRLYSVIDQATRDVAAHILRACDRARGTHYGEELAVNSLDHTKRLQPSQGRQR